MRTYRLWIAWALCAAWLAGCGGSEKFGEIAKSSPHLALPSNAKLVMEFQPGIIAQNPIVNDLRALFGAEGRDLPFTGSIRMLGLDPQRQIERSAWALYDIATMTWAMALVGDLDEEAVLRGIESPVDPRLRAEVKAETYLGMAYHVVDRGGGAGGGSLCLIFPAPGVLLAASNAPLAQKAIAVWQGKADGLGTDRAFKPLLEKASTASQLWFAGFAQGTLSEMQITAGGLFSRGDNLGYGVDTLAGAMDVGPGAVTLWAEFACDNSDTANKQKTNYSAWVQSQGNMLAQSGYGPLGRAIAGLLVFSVEGVKIRVNADVPAELAAQMLMQRQEAEMAARQMQEMLMRQSGLGSPGELPAPRPESELAPEEVAPAPAGPASPPTETIEPAAPEAPLAPPPTPAADRRGRRTSPTPPPEALEQLEAMQTPALTPPVLPSTTPPAPEAPPAPPMSVPPAAPSSPPAQ